MQVTLTKESERLVEEKVRSGRYADASDVMRDALRALEMDLGVEVGGRSRKTNLPCFIG